MTGGGGKERRPSQGSVSLLHHLLAGGAFLPEQVECNSRCAAERRLAAAVIGSALLEVRGADAPRARRRRVDEDLAWIFSDDTTQPFSFVALCDFLSIEPQYLRDRVRRWIGEPSGSVPSDEQARAA